MKEVKLDSWTFGNSPAEVTLASMLDKSIPSVRAYVTRFLGSASRHIKNIKLIDENAGTRDFLYKSLRDSAFKAIDASYTLKKQPELITFVKNAVTIRMRKLLLKK